MSSRATGICVTLSDMDGTLLDSEPLYEAVLNRFTKKYNIQFTAADFAALRGTGTQNFYELLKDREPQFAVDYPDHNVFADKRLASYYNELAQNPHMVKKIEAVCERFEDMMNNGEKALIVTNSSFLTVEKTMAAAALAYHSWKDAMTADQAVQMGYSIKPSGDPYTLGLDRVNHLHNTQHHPENTVVLEDSKVGVRSGFDFGGHIIHIMTDPGQMLSEAEVDHLRQDSLYLQTHYAQVALPDDVMSYTACQPKDFNKVYDDLVSRSQKGLALPRYNNLA